MDLLDDDRPAALGAGEVRLEVIDVDPRHMRTRAFGPLAIELEDVEYGVADPELDPRVAVLTFRERISPTGRSLIGSNPNT